MNEFKFDAIVIHDTSRGHFLAFCKQCRKVYGSGSTKDIAISKLKRNLERYADFIKSRQVGATEVSYSF